MTCIVKDLESREKLRLRGPGDCELELRPSYAHVNLNPMIGGPGLPGNAVEAQQQTTVAANGELSTLGLNSFVRFDSSYLDKMRL